MNPIDALIQSGSQAMNRNKTARRAAEGTQDSTAVWSDGNLNVSAPQPQKVKSTAPVAVSPAQRPTKPSTWGRNTSTSLSQRLKSAGFQTDTTGWKYINGVWFPPDTKKVIYRDERGMSWSGTPEQNLRLLKDGFLISNEGVGSSRGGSGSGGYRGQGGRSKVNHIKIKGANYSGGYGSENSDLGAMSGQQGLKNSTTTDIYNPDTPSIDDMPSPTSLVSTSRRSTERYKGVDWDAIQKGM